jgi:MFS superfamily sulfate permease-like transporter
MILENGAVLEAEVFEAGAEIFVVAENERVPVPVGSYEAEGKTIVVAEEGVIGEIKEAGAETEEEAPATEEVVEEEELSTEATSPKKIVKSISEEMFFSEIEKLRTEINDLKLSKTEVIDEEVVEEVKLSEVEGISHNPEKLADKKELNLYSQKGNKSTTRSRIFNKINK